MGKLNYIPCAKQGIISCESFNSVLSARLIWFARRILYVLQEHKSNDYNVNLLMIAIVNNWL